MSRQFGNLMKQAQVLQQKMAKFQGELEERMYDGQAGGGAVKVVVNGKLVIQSLLIDKSAITPDDPEMLQDVVFAAIRAAQEKAAQTINDEMSKITGGLGMSIPGLF